jgi:hypothetical protein
MAKIKPEFDKRGVKILALSVDPVEKHAGDGFVLGFAKLHVNDCYQHARGRGS